MDSQSKDAQVLQELRRKIFLTGYRGGMAHLASCYSALEILYVLYTKKIIKYDPANPKWNGRDRFILSKGHAGLALYAVLNQAGLLTDEEFSSYLQPGSRIGGEPCMRDSQWVEAATGSLGHGLSMAVGMALALKTEGMDANVYVVLGDGECQEGTVWEAAYSAAAFQLDHLVAVLDCNGLQKMGPVESVMGVTKWEDKWSSFGWSVEETDGHDVAALTDALRKPNPIGQPKLLIAHTVKGKGVSMMENHAGWHFKLPNKKERKVFQQELGIPDAEME